MRYFITGADSFLARNLIPVLLTQGHIVYGLSRKMSPQYYGKGYFPLKGDILIPGLGLDKAPAGIDRIYHLAAQLDLTDNPEVWRTNTEGTQNVCNFALKNSIPHFVLVSSAYANQNGRNLYEKSKAQSESIVEAAGFKRLTVFKPSIIIGTPEIVEIGQAVNRVAAAILKTQSWGRFLYSQTASLSPFPSFDLKLRLRGDPESPLNVIPVDILVWAMVNWDAEGKHFIANPNPPTVGQVANEIGEAVKIRVQVQKHFDSSQMELRLEKMIQPFLAYLKDGEKFPSLLERNFRLPEGYLREVIRAFLAVAPGLYRLVNRSSPAGCDPS